MLFNDCFLHIQSKTQHRSAALYIFRKNLSAVLEAAGSSLEKVVKTVCFLRNMEDFAAFNAVYGKYFTGKPARSCVAVRELPKGVLVEVETIAEL